MERQYKDSGIEWIGRIPDTWKIYRIKYNTFLKGRIGWQGLNSNDFIDEGYCLITGTDFDNRGGINWNTCYRISKDRFDEDELLHIKKGDLLMTKDGTIGKMAYIDDLPEEASLNSHLLIIRQITNLMDNKYLYWTMLSDIFVQFYNLFQSGTTMNSISQSTLGLFSTPCPPIPEQQHIAKYLDEKCGEIDSLIELQEQMIGKLKTYKQSVIIEAVTKGLNPDAKLVPSGIDWIGEIPEGWKINKLFNLCTIKGRVGWKGLRSDEFKEKSYAYLVTGQDFISSDINWNNCYQIDKDRYEEDPYIQLANGDILVTKDGTIGKIAKVSGMDKPACLNSGIFVLKQRKETFFQNYLYWYLSSPLLLRYNTFINTGGTTIIHLYQNVFERFSMIIPPMDEQIAIASYLDEKCSEIDNLIALKQQKIEKLKDYKKSVIYEAVTGKINIDS